MAMPRRLLRGEITYSSAKLDETNILHKLTLWEERNKFFNYTHCKRYLIQTIAAHHLGLSTKENCRISGPDDWLHGSFNLCIPITVESGNNRLDQRLIIRFPLPYRVGEAFRPGNADEKLRCEAGAYAWLQENCPDVPIPYLFGFGLSTGQSLLKTYQSSPAAFTMSAAKFSHGLDIRSPPGVGYLLLEYIDESQGKMLSCTWSQKSQEVKLRNNLFRSLSRIFLSFSRVPLSRIGSFTIGDDGVLRLINRPLSLEIQDLENEHIPVDIPRTTTYSTVDSYVTDILAFHDSRLRYQPNAINSLEDGLYQMAALKTMKAIYPHFFQPELRRGPFVFCLTDLHQSNLFVDDQWTFTKVVDLEWAFSRPVEMLHPPYWLISQPVDGIDAHEYEKLHQEFLDALEDEERRFAPQEPGKPLLSGILRQGWKTGTFWYFLALDSPTGLFGLFYDHIQPRFANFFGIMKCYWSIDADSFIKAKIKDKEDYDLKLGQEFGLNIQPTSQL
ncbi:hypothetical protein B7463_g4434, partial [Scytalidium lignicola]